MIASDFAALIPGARRRSDGKWWDGRCPAHDDRRASLSFADGDRALIVTCQAETPCTVDAITGALGLTVKQLFHTNGNGNGHHANGSGSRIVATYDYCDAEGTLLYQTVRLDPKDFRQRRPDGRGGSVWNLEGLARVPYRLPELAEQTMLVIVEGEKDCDALWNLGVPSTTNVCGAGKWRDTYSETLYRLGVQRVVVIPDNDRPGENHAASVVRSCRAVGIDASVLHLSGFPPLREKHGEDVSDWLDEPPADPVRVELVLPSGAAWTDGAEQASSRISGTARDFCLVVTQRRHVEDTALVVHGAAAAEWMRLAQAFAGPPGAGRPPGLFPKSADGGRARP